MSTPTQAHIDEVGAELFIASAAWTHAAATNQTGNVELYEEVLAMGEAMLEAAPGARYAKPDGSTELLRPAVERLRELLRAYTLRTTLS